MTALEASSMLATLVGLICNWRDERGREPENKFQDFIVWLTHHNFHSLKERIFESDELQRELNELLRQDYTALCTKLDAVTAAISSVADKIDSLSQVTRAVHANADFISEQATAILKFFDHSGAQRMIVLDFPPCLGFLPGSETITAGEPRFLETDVAALATCGLIELVDHNSSGNPIYAITRTGSRFAANVSNNYLPIRPAEKDYS